VHALLLPAGIALVAVAVWLLMRRRMVGGGLAAVVGALTMLAFFSSEEVPGDFTTMAPYVATLLVLALASQRLRMPKADGLPYRRGQGK
jgi:simple sugar transport system permease protein